MKAVSFILSMALPVVLSTGAYAEDRLHCESSPEDGVIYDLRVFDNDAGQDSYEVSKTIDGITETRNGLMSAREIDVRNVCGLHMVTDHLGSQNHNSFYHVFNTDECTHN